MSISIVYRAYPKISKVPVVEFGNKDEMIKFCLGSLKESLGEMVYDFVFISDGCTNRQKEIVKDFFENSAENFLMIDTQGVGNQKSFELQIRSALSSRKPLILILEDDYYINKNDFDLCINVLKKGLSDYCTFYYPYDADSSTGGMSLFNGTYIIDNVEISYTRLPSTTLTFMTNFETLKEDYEYFLMFSKGAHDSSLWLRLTSNFLWFLTRIRHRLFYKNPKLYVSVIKRYLMFMTCLKLKRRTLVYVGTGSSAHLDSDGFNNRFNNKIVLKSLYEMME